MLKAQLQQRAHRSRMARKFEKKKNEFRCVHPIQTSFDTNKLEYLYLMFFDTQYP